MNKNSEIIDNLREKGIKVTPQRIAILNFLEGNKIHPCIEDIYNYVTKEYPTISLATVYNTMDMLEDINEVIKLKIGKDNKVNYDYDTLPHNHFYCKKCKKIYDLEYSFTKNIPEDIKGNKVEEVHAYFKGVCKKCFDQLN